MIFQSWEQGRNRGRIIIITNCAQRQEALDKPTGWEQRRRQTTVRLELRRWEAKILVGLISGHTGVNDHRYKRKRLLTRTTRFVEWRRKRSQISSVTLTHFEYGKMYLGNGLYLRAELIQFWWKVISCQSTSHGECEGNNPGVREDSVTQIKVKKNNTQSQ